MKYFPQDIPQRNLRFVGEVHFTYLGSGPIDAVRLTVTTGINPSVTSIWESLLEQIKTPLEGEVHFTVSNIKEVVPNQRYKVYLKFFVRG